MVFTTQSETSTGVLNDIGALAAVARDHGAVYCVDVPPLAVAVIYLLLGITIGVLLA